MDDENLFEKIDALFEVGLSRCPRRWGDQIRHVDMLLLWVVSIFQCHHHHHHHQPVIVQVYTVICVRYLLFATSAIECMLAMRVGIHLSQPRKV